MLPTFYVPSSPPSLGYDSGVSLSWLSSKQVRHGETVMTEQQADTSRWDCEWLSSIHKRHDETVMTEHQVDTSWWDYDDSSEQLQQWETVMTEQQADTSRWGCDDWVANNCNNGRLWWLTSAQLHHGSDDMATEREEVHHLTFQFSSVAREGQNRL